MRAIIYARCSTDEKKQDVEVQLKELRDYCKRKGWEYDELFEYESSYKGVPDKLRKALKLVEKKMYDVFLVHDLSRFSRQHPATTIKMLNFIIDHNCRFISLQNNLDSKQEHTWFIFMGGFAYFNWIYSRNLSDKTKLGIKNVKEIIKKKGYYKSKKTGRKIKGIGRPAGSKDKKPRSKKGYYLKNKERLPFDL